MHELVQHAVIRRFSNGQEPATETVVAIHATYPEAALNSMTRVQANTDDDVTYFSIRDYRTDENQP